MTAIAGILMFVGAMLLLLTESRAIPAVMILAGGVLLAVSMMRGRRQAHR